MLWQRGLEKGFREGYAAPQAAESPVPAGCR